LAIAPSRAAENDQAKVAMGKAGELQIPAFELPLSFYMSEEAKKAFIHNFLNPPPYNPTDDIAKLRKEDTASMMPWLEQARARYAVSIEERSIAGVPAAVVTPKSGIAAGNIDRVLINLHGGAFAFGAGVGGLIESLPIAATGKITVITLDYRQAPEYKFPAASEDIANVYRELLKRYQAGNIGIYGCSAGGALTAMSVAWFQKERLPRPGAIGILCAAADAMLSGDSAYVSAATTGQLPPQTPPDQRSHAAYPITYLNGVNLKDSLVSPVYDAAVLAKFPPTLVITGMRSAEASAAVYTHTQLVKAGVDADLHVWEGMWHGFIYDVSLPESQEAYDVIVKFFSLHLGKSGSVHAGPPN